MILKDGQLPIYVFTCSMCNESTVERFDYDRMYVDYEIISGDFMTDYVSIKSVHKKCTNCGFEIVIGSDIFTIGDIETRNGILNKLTVYEQNKKEEK